MIRDLAKKICAKKEDIDRWHQYHLDDLQGPLIPVYSSVDIRNSGFKISVVDTNLFPAGFNNLCETFSEKAADAFKLFFRKYHPSVQKILIFPEEHTRNIHYWKNISALSRILKEAGFETQVGSASTLFPYPFHVEIDKNSTVTVHRLFLKDGFLQTKNFVPDAILINNDLSAGTPEYLKGLHQLLIPSPHLGWHRRRKSDHFIFYEQLIREMSEILEIDPWLLFPLMSVETGVDFSDTICLKHLEETANRLLSQIRQKYLQYGIPREPYLFIKNNAGTYGIGVTHIDSGKRFLELNRKTRNKLESAKGGQRVNEYILQEGIPTADFYRGKPLEPVVYLVGGEAAGTFFRIHEQKNEFENLNAPGMSFGCLCFHKMDSSKCDLTYDNKDDLFLVTALLGRVASLAAALELKKTCQILKIKSA